MKAAFPIPLDQLVGMGSVIALVPSLSLQRVLWPRISCPRDGSLQWCYFAALKQCQHISSPFPLSFPWIYAEQNQACGSDAFYEAVNPPLKPMHQTEWKRVFFCPTTKISLFKSPPDPKESLPAPSSHSNIPISGLFPPL